jgi:rubrerythrin
MTKTDENLKAAFAGESQANRMYLAFAKKAEKKASHKLPCCLKLRLKQKPSMP